MTTPFALLKKHIFLTLLVIVAAVVVGWSYASRGEDIAYESAIVVRKDIVKEVSVTGKVKPAKAVQLAFEQGGRITNISVKEGSRTLPGAILAQQENGEAAADVLEARAAVLSAEAALAALRRGTRSEEVGVEEKKAESAKVDLYEAIRSLSVALEDAYSKADDAVHNKADKLYINPETSNPNIVFVTSNSALESEIEAGRVSVGKMLALWKTEITLKIADEAQGAAIAKTSESHLSEVRSFLDRLTMALTYAVASGGVTQTTIDGYRADISAARTSINTAIGALQADAEALSKTKAALVLVNASLTLKQAPTTPEDIAKGQADLDQARARLVNMQARAAKYSLISPIAGTVTKVYMESGEIAGAGAPAISLNSRAAFQVEAFVPETDIALIHMGLSARVTLDAYGEDEMWEAKVLSIDPSETVIDGVSTYKTLLEFSNTNDDRVKSGMTANIEIISEKKEGVLSLPRRFVLQKNGKHIVLVQSRDAEDKMEPVEKEVSVGITGSDGSIEILSGINEGETVVFMKK